MHEHNMNPWRNRGSPSTSRCGTSASSSRRRRRIDGGRGPVRHPPEKKLPPAGWSRTCKQVGCDRPSGGELQGGIRCSRKPFARSRGRRPRNTRWQGCGAGWRGHGGRRGTGSASPGRTGRASFPQAMDGDPAASARRSGSARNPEKRPPGHDSHVRHAQRRTPPKPPQAPLIHICG